ncbi:hypothetical protein [Sandaracinus amylolyticus]|uniref:hypothetical protein n=1 Tax=Sandaracinus amylolyticus TaxID=927083 RepID=UPI001F4837CB|nr:hypothetical protein [Sandaracinus amylolyticus]
MSAVPELRRAALARAATMRDGRVAEVLRRSIVHVFERAGDAWESSDGTVRAIDVRLEVDGHALGSCETFPSVRDAVIVTITAEAPRVLGASVVDLAIVWGVRERSVEAGYRDDAGEPLDRGFGDDVKRALVGFLRASGDDESARALAGGELEIGAREVDVIGARVETSKLEPALAVLYGRPMRVRAR